MKEIVKMHNFRVLIDEFNAIHNYKFVFNKNINEITIAFNKTTTKEELETAQIKYTTQSGIIVNTTLEAFVTGRKNIAYTVSSLPLNMIRDFLYNYQKAEDITIQLWDSNKIKYAYLHTNYHQMSGTLGSSCMRSKDMQKALNFYEKNGVKILVAVTAGNKICGRALYWPEVYVSKDKEPIVYVDRVYFTVEYYKQAFYKWIREAGHSSYDLDINVPVDFLHVRNITVGGICHLPYTDTFRKLYYESKVLAKNEHRSCKGRLVTLTHTGDRGYFRELDPHSVKEALSGDWCSKKDCTFIKQYNGYVLNDNIANIDGTYYSKRDIKNVYKTNLDNWILKKNKVDEAVSGEAIDKTKAIKSKHYKGYLHKKNAIKIHGILYHKADENIVQYKDKKWYYINQCFSTIVYNTDGYKTGKKLIPKKCAVICYKLSEDADGNIQWKEIYKDEDDCRKVINSVVVLTTGEWIINDDESRKCVKRYNKRFYIKKDWKPIDKNQMLLPYKE